jgi:hypothetical protein
MMSEPATAGSQEKAWLLIRSGPRAGARFPIPDGTIRVGRAPHNDVVVNGADSAMVSLCHLEISRVAGSVRLRDLGSTNGTWLNGERITDTEISPPATIQLGKQGPELAFVLESAAPAHLDRTIRIAPDAINISRPAAAPAAAHEGMLAAAVMRARRLRVHGAGGQTLAIMHALIEQVLRRSHRRHRTIGYALLAALLTVSAVGLWKITAMNREKRAIDAHIQQLEAELQQPREGSDTDRLLSTLNDYQDRAESLQRTLLYRLGGKRQQDDFVTRELRALMAELGAEAYSIPPDFIERVNHYIEQYQGPDRPLVQRALTGSGNQLQTIRAVLREEQLPMDLAYIPLVESALAPGPASAAGAAGPWQLTVATARGYGLRVDREVDERKNLVKATKASCKYLRDLILDFGAGSSVMLALAAYNSGTAKVKQAVVRTVRDPIKQRNFWYLYRLKALPLETREYVPKVFAAMLIGRNPHHFGF